MVHVDGLGRLCEAGDGSSQARLSAGVSHTAHVQLSQTPHCQAKSHHLCCCRCCCCCPQSKALLSQVESLSPKLAAAARNHADKGKALLGRTAKLVSCSTTVHRYSTLLEICAVGFSVVITCLLLFAIQWCAAHHLIATA
jgi:hypothetical protein